MPFLILTYLVQVFCAVHALRRGHPIMLVFMILAFPFLGCLIYLFLVLIPEWSNSRTAMKTKSAVRGALDPGRELREAAKALEVSDTVGNRLRMADELAAKGDAASAVPLYEGCLEGVYADSPEIMLKLAQAHFDAGDFAAAKDTLEGLIEQNPDYRSDEGHLLYARALEGAGEADKALREYAAVSGYYSGPQARCHYGLLLEKLGRDQQARQQFQMVVEGARHVTAKLRERHKDWLNLAESRLR